MVLKKKNPLLMIRQRKKIPKIDIPIDARVEEPTKGGKFLKKGQNWLDYGETIGNWYLIQRIWPGSWRTKKQKTNTHQEEEVDTTKPIYYDT